MPLSARRTINSPSNNGNGSSSNKGNKDSRNFFNNDGYKTIYKSHPQLHNQQMSTTTTKGLLACLFLCVFGGLLNVRHQTLVTTTPTQTSASVSSSQYSSIPSADEDDSADAATSWFHQLFTVRSLSLSLSSSTSVASSVSYPFPAAPLALVFSSSSSSFLATSTVTTSATSTTTKQNNSSSFPSSTPSSSSSWTSSLLPLSSRKRRQARIPDYGTLNITILRTTSTASLAPLPPPRSLLSSEEDARQYNAEREYQLWYIDRFTSPNDISRSDPTRYHHWDEIDYPERCHRLKWSFSMHPTCNQFHDYDFASTIVANMGGEDATDATAKKTGLGASLAQQTRLSQTGASEWNMKYLGRGHYRSTWMLTQYGHNTDDLQRKQQEQQAQQMNNDNKKPKLEEKQKLVWKSLRLVEARNFTIFDHSQAQLEAMAMEKTTSSRRTFSIYGHCGTSLLVQPGRKISRITNPYDDIVDQRRLDLMNSNNEKQALLLPSNGEKQQQQPPFSMNILKPEQKLMLALAMAEGIATLHGHDEGVIVNDDISLSQFLIAEEVEETAARGGAAARKTELRLKLNDFNNARIPKWKFEEPNRYCMFKSSFSWINRPPEELKAGYTDESADVFALANVFYTVVTGLLAFYHHKDWDEAVRALRHGQRPYLDPLWKNTMIERRMGDIMEQCWVYKPASRVSIFEVVRQLRETKKLYESQTNQTLNESELLREMLREGDELNQWMKNYNLFVRTTRTILKNHHEQKQQQQQQPSTTKRAKKVEFRDSMESETSEESEIEGYEQQKQQQQEKTVENESASKEGDKKESGHDDGDSDNDKADNVSS